jgi:outer membrane protein assembly factor BamB
LIGADGELLWRYDALEPVLALTSANLHNETHPRLEVILALQSRIVALSTEGERLWQRNVTSGVQQTIKEAAEAVLSNELALQPVNPVLISGYDQDGDGRDEILLLLDSGHILAYDASGTIIWRYSAQNDYSISVEPRAFIEDMDADGQDEVVLAFFSPRRFSQLVYFDQGKEQWNQAISRRITAIAPVSFNGVNKQIAVGTNFGQLDLYEVSGERQWFRTVNKAITALEAVELPGGRALAVGTESGSVLTYSEEGRRLWTNNLSRLANREIISLSASGSRLGDEQAVLAVTLGDTAAKGPADVFLLGSNGQTLQKLATTDLPALTRLVDSNHDGRDELLLARFSIAQLQGLGVGNSEYIQQWSYTLNAAPSASMMVDLDNDGEEEVIIGTQDGRIHSLNNNRDIRWLHAIGGAVTHLAVLRNPSDEAPRVVVVHSTQSGGEESSGTAASLQAGSFDGLRAGSQTGTWLEVRRAEGERLWQAEIPDGVSALLVHDVANHDHSSIIVGTISGQVMAFDTNGNLLWEQALSDIDLSGGIRHLLLPKSSGAQQSEEVLAAGEQVILALRQTPNGILRQTIASFESPIYAVYEVEQPSPRELATTLIVFTGDGLVHGLNRNGIEMAHWRWPFDAGGAPLAVLPDRSGILEAFQENSPAFLLATTANQLLRLDVSDNQPVLLWDLSGTQPVTGLFWRDSNNDAHPDTVLSGTQNGLVHLYELANSREPRLALQLNVGSSVYDLTLLERIASQTPDLLVITQNGLIQLFREQENRPPLLTHPTVRLEEGLYSIGVQVNDVENDQVLVQLELYDPASEQWVGVADMPQTLTNGNGPLFWPSIRPREGVERMRYRFHYDDGFYNGYVTPPEGPAVVPLPALQSATPQLIFAGAGLGLLTFVFYLFHSRSSNAQAGRFYRRLRQQPEVTLTLIEKKYAVVKGSPDFLLQLTSQARQSDDGLIAGLADGLFLLANRPLSGIAIIQRTLEDASAQGLSWRALALWQTLVKTCQGVLEAPSITELSLLRPQFVHLLNQFEEDGEWSPVLDSLLPILTNLRDSERVERAEDRLVYLNQAAVRLEQLQEQLPEFSASIQRTLVKVIVRRWSGLVSAETEELRGRAELEVSLKTRRIVPNGRTEVALEIRNNGRAAAENVIATLEGSAAYYVHSRPQTIPFLPPGRTRQIHFSIEPLVLDRFRIALSVTFDDRNRSEKQFAFGDMVHQLPPAREFRPIVNPYMPGTPLRPASPLFFGREELFDFIAENAGSVGANARAHRNVLILIGQRRTGKTSALLRLEEHVPPHLLPVYIDCQSLGVVPGMPALLQEFAWHIADALAERDIVVEVPEMNEWQEDPTHLFQRQFLPQVRALLPPDTTLLLIFDEFEAFEEMVGDSILPRTLFTYLRHLMQHSEGLNFIFVGTRRLEEMSADYWSVLFNIALYKKIDYLSTEAATRLISEPVGPYLVYDDLAIDKILRVTAGHPYFLQLVCYTLVKRANTEKTPYITVSDVNAGLEEMLRLGEVHFAYLWQRSSATERALLTAAANLMDHNVPLHPEEFTRYLESYSIELDPADVTTGLNSLVDRDILREVTEEAATLYELRIGLVGLWVSQNKSLSKLYAHHP